MLGAALAGGAIFAAVALGFDPVQLYHRGGFLDQMVGLATMLTLFGAPLALGLAIVNRLDPPD